MWPSEKLINSLIDHERWGGAGFYWRDESTTSAESFLADIETHQYRQFFASPQAATLVLTHMKRFRAWWDPKTKGASRQERLDVLSKLHSRPTDWPNEGAPLAIEWPQFSLRLELPLPGQAWFNEVGRWNRTGAWDQHTDFVVSAIPRSQRLAVDVVSAYGLDLCHAHACATRLAEICEKTWTNLQHRDNHRFWRSIAVFAAAILEARLDVTSHRCHVAAVENKDGRPAYAVACREPETLRTKVVEIAAQLPDERAMELRALTETGGEIWSPVESGVWIALLGRLFVVASDTGTEATEVDGILMRFGPTALQALAVELKTGKQSGARQMSRLKRLFRIPAEITTNRTSAGKTWSVEWPIINLPASIHERAQLPEH